MGLRAHAERSTTRPTGFHSGILEEDSFHPIYVIGCLNVVTDYPFRIDARFTTRTQVARSILYALTAVCSSSRTNSRRYDSLEDPFFCKSLSFF